MQTFTRGYKLVQKNFFGDLGYSLMMRSAIARVETQLLRVLEEMEQ